jgi:hypothetical protein
MTTALKNKTTNKVEFFQGGKKVFPTKINGNVVSFKNGDIILI